jgi:hypothetical protein
MSNGIQKIIQRIGGSPEQGLIEKTYSYLEGSKRESGVAQETFFSKERETEAVKEE